MTLVEYDWTIVVQVNDANVPRQFLSACKLSATVDYMEDGLYTLKSLQTRNTIIVVIAQKVNFVSQIKGSLVQVP